MASITNEVTIDAAAITVWQTVRDFSGIHQWLPDVLHCQVRGEGVGAIRVATYLDGFQVTERLDALDDSLYRLCYTVLTATPFADAWFTMSVQDIDDDHCDFIWSCHFTPQGLPLAEAEELMGSALARGCAGLHALFIRLGGNSENAAAR
jgi:hypothetical protein